MRVRIPMGFHACLDPQIVLSSIVYVQRTARSLTARVRALHRGGHVQPTAAACAAYVNLRLIGQLNVGLYLF